MEIAAFVKERRKVLKLTQPELASKAGVGLRFVRELEQGKNTLRMDKVNQVLQMFGMELGPIEIPRQNYSYFAETDKLKTLSQAAEPSVKIKTNEKRRNTHK